MPVSSEQTRLLLIRHPQVADRYRGVCYGQSDVELSPEGRLSCEGIAETVSQLQIARIVHTDMQRTRLLAEMIGRRVGLLPTQEVALRERNFGSWELQTWDDIYSDSGDDMSKMLTEPGGFRPGGGETTHELAARVCRWSQEWTSPGVTVVVAHGGSIAALLGCQRSLPASQWPDLIPACAEMVWYVPRESGSPV